MAGGDTSVAGGHWASAFGRQATASGEAAAAMGLGARAAGPFTTALRHGPRPTHERSLVWLALDIPLPSFLDRMFFVHAPNGLGIHSGPQPLDGGGLGWINLVLVSQGNLADTAIGTRLSLGGPWMTSSDVRRKTDFAEMVPQAVLARVVELPIRQRRYTKEVADIRYSGPTSEGFRAA